MVSPWSPWRTTVKQISTCSLWRNLQRTVSTTNKAAAHRDPTHEQVLKTRQGPWEKSRLLWVFWKKLWDPYWSSLYLKVSKPYHMEEAHHEAVLEALQPVGRHVGTVWEGLYPTGGTSNHGRVPMWKGKTNRYEALWNHSNPLSPGPWDMWREEIEKARRKLNLERRELGEGRWF